MLDPQFTITTQSSQDNYQQLVLEPLRQGYGHTLGNALRRVLLSSLPGYAITSIKIKGATHQFTSIPGVKEDVVALILNIKNVRVHLENIDSATLKISATGPSKVTAANIIAPAGVSIANPESYICELSDKSSKFEAELTVEAGQGYSLAEERKSDSLGVIPIDALYSPIRRVNTTIEATRVGRRTDYDKLILDIWTDGTITGESALKTASMILVEHFSQIINPQVDGQTATTVNPANISNQEVLKLTVEELDLATRIANALRKGGYKTVEHLSQASRDEIAKVKNLGERSVSLVEDALAKKGVHLTH